MKYKDSWSCSSLIFLKRKFDLEIELCWIKSYQFILSNLYCLLDMIWFLSSDEEIPSSNLCLMQCVWNLNSHYIFSIVIVTVILYKGIHFCYSSTSVLLLDIPQIFIIGQVYSFIFLFFKTWKGIFNCQVFSQSYSYFIINK